MLVISLLSPVRLILRWVRVSNSCRSGVKCSILSGDVEPRGIGLSVDRRDRGRGVDRRRNGRFEVR